MFWIEFLWNDFESNIELNQFWAKFKHWIELIWVSNRAIKASFWLSAFGTEPVLPSTEVTSPFLNHHYKSMVLFNKLAILKAMLLQNTVQPPT